jgi:6-phosphofructokinase 1
MSSVLEGNAVIGQSGGPTHVINQSLAGCVQELRKHACVQRILGARHGVRGIVQDDFVDLTHTPQDVLDRVAITPSAALGSSRDKPDAAYCQKIFESFKRNNVRYFFYIGGNDSSDTCRIVNERAKAEGYDLRSFHVPKTIDNDLVLNDHTPGFGSAARFVACAFMGDNLDNKSLKGIKIDIIMGRHAGWLTAASVLGRQRETDGPHNVYVPEVVFDPDKFLRDVETAYKRFGRCLVAVSEGIHDAEKTPIAVLLAKRLGKAVEVDDHGNPQLSGSGVLGDFLSDLVKEHLGKKTRVRADTFGYLQRSCAGMASEVDQQEAREVAAAAVDCAMSGQQDGSMTIKRNTEGPYGVHYERVELSAVAAKTRHLPAAYIVNDNDIAPAFREYALPLTGPLPVVEQL